MQRHFFFILFSFYTMFPALFGFTQDTPIRNDFSKNSIETNRLTVMGAGFGSMPLADISFGDVPLDQSFPDATDGKGMIIKAEPGKTALILLEVVQTKQAAMLRCSIRTDSADASIYLASIDQGPNTFVSTITPNNGGYFLNHWKRLADFFLPPSSRFQPLIQIVNTSKTQTLTVYIDNYDVYLLDSQRFYNTQFLDGDETDPSVISIPFSSASSPNTSPQRLRLLVHPL